MQQQQCFIRLGNYRYNQKYCVGQGSFGKVYKGTNVKTNRTVAIKQVDSTLTSEVQVNKQIQILKTLKHKNIVQYEDAFQNNGYFYIVTQYCNGGDLRNLLEDSDESFEQGDQKFVQKWIDMFLQICEGFQYLQKFQIIHRDLKPSNILINNGIYKIADFGLAKTQKINRSIIHNDLIGVPIYMSPQILTRNFYSYKCDVWSCGVIFYEMYFGKLPWKANDIDELFFEIMRHPTPYYQCKQKLPNIVKNILEGTLCYLQKQRLQWNQLISVSKGRKKIFDQPRSKSINLKSNKLTNTLLQHTEVKPSKYNSSHNKSQVQTIFHIKAQCQCLKQELNKLINQQSLDTYILTLNNYLLKGPSYRQILIDCSSMIIKILSENLHMYMIQLQSMEDSRDLLILLQLMYDISIEGGDKLKAIVANSKRNEQIGIYAAEVINKINTERLYKIQ